MPRKIPLTRGKFAIVDDDIFDVLSKHSWHTSSNGYARNGGREYMHRIIMRPRPGLTIDHINLNKLDNRRANLRICSMRDNIRNGPKKKTKNPYKGVFWEQRTRRWFAQISVNYRSVFLGRYRDPIDAAYAYDFAAIMIHGEFARPNFP